MECIIVELPFSKGVNGVVPHCCVVTNLECGTPLLLGSQVQPFRADMRGGEFLPLV
jgi:hypothetical protein